MDLTEGAPESSAVGEVDVPASGRVPTPGGYAVSEAAARWAALGVPDGTERARRSRAGLYTAWCREYGRIGTDDGALADYAAHLADLQHPSETIAAYLTPLYHLRELSRRPVLTHERALVQQIINGRSAQDATAPDGQGDALQVTECTRADLVAMLGTCDRGAVRGRRDALALVLAWYLGARASEVPALALRDVTEVTARLTDADGGEVERAALVVTIRRSKTNPYGRRTETVRLLAQSDSTCPVAAYRAWAEVLAVQAPDGAPGPLLRRVRDGRLTTAGRPPKDARWREGVGDRWLRDLISGRAAAAKLTTPWTKEERALLSTLEEKRELAAIEAAAEERAADLDASGRAEVWAAARAAQEEVRVRRRLARRALRRDRPRYAGHSMRRGQVRDQQRRRVPRHITELHCRYVPGSKALPRYLDDALAWNDNPTG